MLIDVQHTSWNGHLVVTLPISKGKMRVRLSEEAFSKLKEMGLGLRWIFRKGRVHVRNNGEYIPVARFIVDAKRRDKVLYYDNDPLNLVTSNRVICRSARPCKDRDVIRHPFKHKTVQVTHSYVPGLINRWSFNFE